MDSDVQKGMANQPKEHHYVPAFHLAGFTLSGTQDGKLFILDQKRRDNWESTPRKTAKENNFYRVDMKGGDPMGIERALADVEGKCATVVRDIVKSQKVPADREQFEVMLNFVAIAAVRVPIIRQTHSEFIDKVTKDVVRLGFLGTDGATLLRKLSKTEGKPLTDEEIQQIQHGIENDHFTYNLDQNWHIQTMIEVAGALLPALGMRNWGVWTVADDAPDLVCSDRPVTLTATAPFPPLLSPAFGTPKTLMTLPLTRRVLLVSQFEPLPNDSYIMDEKDVALMNTYRMMYSNQMYSAQENWPVIADGKIVDIQTLLASVPPFESDKE